MLLITIVLTFTLIFLCGAHYTAYRVDRIEQRSTAMKSLFWSMGCGVIGLYHLIAIVGLAAKGAA